MHQDVLRNKRRQIRNEVNFWWSAFTQEDLHNFDGGRDHLIVMLETRYGFARRRAEREADRFFNHFEDKLERAA